MLRRAVRFTVNARHRAGIVNAARPIEIGTGYDDVAERRAVVQEAAKGIRRTEAIKAGDNPGIVDAVTGRADRARNIEFLVRAARINKSALGAAF